GVALNCVGNGKILCDGPFENIWIQPAAGDAGGALGVALLIWHHLLAQPRTVCADDAQSGSLLGPRFGEEEIVKVLEAEGACYHVFEQAGELLDSVTNLLAAEQGGGGFQDSLDIR